MRTKLPALLALTLLAGPVPGLRTRLSGCHVEVNPRQIAIWTDAAREFEAKNPGVSIQPQYLENEAYKSKLTTLLQSRDKPAMFYSWAGRCVAARRSMPASCEDLTRPGERLMPDTHDANRTRGIHG